MWAMPVDGQPRVTSTFGVIRQSGKPHGGVDIGVKLKPVKAVQKGIVEEVGFNHPVNGNYIVVLHPDGKRSGYVHLDSVFVSVGTPVKKREQIAISGNTGRVRGKFGGYHLHLAAWNRAGHLVDPSRYLPDLRPGSPWPIVVGAVATGISIVGVVAIAIRRQNAI